MTKILILYKEEYEKTIYTDYYQKHTSQNFKKFALLPILKGSLQSLYERINERGEYSWGKKRERLYPSFVPMISFYT